MKNKNSKTQKNPTNLAKKLFGTDGIRGCANIYPMNPDNVLRIGQAIGTYFKKHYEKPRILIGKDTRKSGYLLEQALSSGICSVGVDTFFLGPLPTPGIAYITRGMRANAGIVISASHNPFYDNGIKIFSSDGYKLPDQAEQDLEELILSNTFNLEKHSGANIGISLRIDDAVGQYAVFLKEQFPKHYTLEGIRIVLDCANGAGYKVAPKVFEELGAEVFTINDKPNGININENCGALHPQNLVNAVKLYKADMGFALDGDADRLIATDEHGDLLDGDEILAICGSHYLKKKRLNNNTVVSTVMSNMGLDLAIKKEGGQVIRTNVGDRNVVNLMRKHNFNLGGEQSGHLIFHDCSTTGDGILAALSLLEAYLEEQKPLSKLRSVMCKFPQIHENIPIPSKIPIEHMPEVSKKIDQINQTLTPEGRVIFRYSGTELKARIMIEGSDENKIYTYAKELSHLTSKTIEAYHKKHHSPQPHI